jgi:hypothetical protein
MFAASTDAVSDKSTAIPQTAITACPGIRWGRMEKNRGTLFLRGEAKMASQSRVLRNVVCMRNAPQFECLRKVFSLLMIWYR